MGLKAVVDRAAVGLPDETPEPVQLGLLGEREPAALAAAGPAREPGKAGRPLGAINKATADVKAFLERRYRSPLVGLAELGSGAELAQLLTRAKTIAAELGCKPIEALKVIIDASDKLAPFMHSKMPQIHDAKAVGGVTLVQITAESLAAAGGNIAVAVMIATGEQNQEVIEGQARELDGLELDGSPISQ